MFGSKSSSTPKDNEDGTPDDALEARQERRQAEMSRIERTRDVGSGYEGGLGGTGKPTSSPPADNATGTKSLG